MIVHYPPQGYRFRCGPYEWDQWRIYSPDGRCIGERTTEKAAWLAMGFVAWCACGHAYTTEGWAELPLVGTVDDVIEQRNCVCGSTISLEL